MTEHYKVMAHRLPTFPHATPPLERGMIGTLASILSHHPRCWEETMDADQVKVQEETLDPQDWEEMRELGHQMLDDMFEHLQTLRDRPAWQPIPQEVRDFLTEPAPGEG